MNKTIILPLVALLALAAACGADGGPGTGLPLGPAPWKDGDRVVYDRIDRNGSGAGTVEYSFKKDGNAWVLTDIDRTAKLEQTMNVRLDARTLRPLAGEKSMKGLGTNVNVKSTYKEGKLEISAVVNGVDKVASVDIAAGALDNDQLLMTVRALKFADGYAASSVHVAGLSGMNVDIDLAVRGKETIQAPAGSFEAWVVELDFGQTRHRAWYQVESPQNMVQYDSDSFKLVLTR